MRVRPLVASVLLLSMAPVFLQAQSVVTKIDPAAIRAAAEPAVCLVMVENTWGVPLAVATGFLLGDGRFAVTDLGVVAQPAVAKATLRFSDGSTAVCTQFGMADPALGLVALRVGSGRSRRRGLPLAPHLPSLDGIGAIAAAGWQWGKEIEVVTGRVWRGPEIRRVAARTRVNPPAGVEFFLRMAGGRIEAASGSPVLDWRGTVLAVCLDVAAPGVSVELAMPASSLRRSLLESEPRLRAFSDLPDPLWPVHLLRLSGKPPNPDGFARVRDHVRASVVCTDCKGRGTVRAKDQKRWDDKVECPRCHGEGVALESGVYELLATWAEQGTRVVWSPRPGGRAQGTARAAGQEMLKWLMLSGRRFREAHSEATGRDLNRLGNPSPRGVIVFAEVRDTISGPDGVYVILDPLHTNYMVVVREQDLMGHDGKGPSGGGHRPADKSWVVLAGSVLSRFEVGRYHGVYVLPFEWRRCSVPGPLNRMER